MFFSIPIFYLFDYLKQMIKKLKFTNIYPGSIIYTLDILLNVRSSHELSSDNPCYLFRELKDYGFKFSECKAREGFMI